MLPGLPANGKAGCFPVSVSFVLSFCLWVINYSTQRGQWHAKLQRQSGFLNLVKGWLTILSQFKIYKPCSCALLTCSSRWEKSLPSKTNIYLENCFLQVALPVSQTLPYNSQGQSSFSDMLLFNMPCREVAQQNTIGLFNLACWGHFFLQDWVLAAIPVKWGGNFLFIYLYFSTEFPGRIFRWRLCWNNYWGMLSGDSSCARVRKAGWSRRSWPMMIPN